ncbi:hypothetical protein D915_009477 [Fasciola hepatica]|uniref:ABM domain-containing protein n=1 Tax=Fasciola hepatica TaxID=6192 RepID=A0A4E0R156_FASHE|nr:hypothetical protein D915_009477 [Fasciola hepatica]
MRNYGNGRPIGVAENITYIRGIWKPNMTIALLQFDNEEQACLWMQSDPHFRRHDWLDDHDTIVIPTRSELAAYPCVEINAFQRNDVQMFEADFLPKYEKNVENAGGKPAICSTERIRVWRGSNDISYMMLTQWRSSEAAQEWHHSQEATDLHALRPYASGGWSVLADMKLSPHTE